MRVGRLAGRAARCELFMEIREENEAFEVYRDWGFNLKLFIIKVPSEEIEGPSTIRAEQGWTVQYLKEHIARVRYGHKLLYSLGV